MANRNPSQSQQIIAAVIAVAFLLIVFACCLIGPPGGDAVQPSGPKLPGILPVDVYGNYTDKGFVKAGPNAIDDGLGNRVVIWTLRQQEGEVTRIVEIFGHSPSDVYHLRGSLLNSGAGDTDRLATEFLGFVATVPYDGSDQRAARQWVADNVHRNAETIIGGVKFSIEANAPHARVLTIQAIQ